MAMNATLPRQNRDLRPINHPEFAHQVADVNFDRRLGKTQGTCNFLVGEAGLKRLQNFDLTS